jgi:6-pyruvoyltetrahydropterin/6-carboxytetrahydropterin synthase
VAVLVTRRERFSAGHRLFIASLSDAENLEIFGKCSNPQGHGHNYTLEVTVEGEMDARTGFVVDLSALSQLMKKFVIDDVDHKNLNVDVDWLSGLMPTTEMLASVFWDRLDPHLPPGSLHTVRLYETDKNWAERRR